MKFPTDTFTKATRQDMKNYTIFWIHFINKNYHEINIKFCLLKKKFPIEPFTKAATLNRKNVKNISHFVSILII